KTFDGGGENVLPVVLASHVARQCQHLRSVGGQGAGQLVQCVGRACDQGQARSFLSRLFGQATTDAAGRTRNQDASPAQISTHAIVSRSTNQIYRNFASSPNLTDPKKRPALFWGQKGGRGGAEGAVPVTTVRVDSLGTGRIGNTLEAINQVKPWFPHRGARPSRPPLCGQDGRAPR